MNSAGRPKIKYDVNEIKEIIELKLNSIDFDMSKFTYNSVFNFNKYLVKSQKYNSQNKLFKLYGYSFWATDYKGKSNYGKEQIDLYKQHTPMTAAGEIFEVDTYDIETIIDNNINNPQKMKRILIKMFNKERRSNANNDKTFYEIHNTLNEYKIMVEQYKKVLFTLFYNSRFSNNSLNDVITLKKEGDENIKKTIYQIFDDNTNLINELIYNHNDSKKSKIDESIANNIFDMASILNSKKER